MIGTATPVYYCGDPCPRCGRMTVVESCGERQCAECGARVTLGSGDPPAPASSGGYYLAPVNWTALEGIIERALERDPWLFESPLVSACLAGWARCPYPVVGGPVVEVRTWA